MTPKSVNSSTESNERAKDPCELCVLSPVACYLTKREAHLQTCPDKIEHTEKRASMVLTVNVISLISYSAIAVADSRSGTDATTLTRNFEALRFLQDVL